MANFQLSTPAKSYFRAGDIQFRELSMVRVDTSRRTITMSDSRGPNHLFGVRRRTPLPHRPISPRWTRAYRSARDHAIGGEVLTVIVRSYEKLFSTIRLGLSSHFGSAVHPDNGAECLDCRLCGRRAQSDKTIRLQGTDRSQNRCGQECLAAHGGAGKILAPDRRSYSAQS